MKAIVNLLKPLLPEVVAPNQSSFIFGRNKLDNIVGYQEVPYTSKTKKGTSEGMLMKLNLEKVYDCLSWIFIEDTLCRLNLPTHLVRVIILYLSSASFRVLWNGEPIEVITPTRGLLQGDPLSPYISMLFLERLGHLIEEKVEEGYWKSVSLNRRGPKLSYLCFADDITLFSQAEVAQDTILKQCLQTLCNDSGQ